MPQIDIVAAQSALGENGGHRHSVRACALLAGIDHHARQPWWQGQLAQSAAFVGNAALRVDRAEFKEQRLRLVHRRLRRGIDESKLSGVGSTPLRQIEHEAGQIGR